jgi:hypothetical protein
MKPSTAALNSSARSTESPCGAPGRIVSFEPGISDAISFAFQTGTRTSCSPPSTWVGMVNVASPSRASWPEDARS